MEKHQKYATDHNMSSHFVSAKTGDSVSDIEPFTSFQSLASGMLRHLFWAPDFFVDFHVSD